MKKQSLPDAEACDALFTDLLSFLDKRRNITPREREVVEALRASLVNNYDLYRELAK